MSQKETAEPDEPDEQPPNDDQNEPFHAIVDADTLAATVDSLKVLVDEARIHCNNDGLHAQMAEPANVGMVYLDLDAAAFESYQGADGGILGVNLSRLQDILGMATSDDLVELQYDPETRKLHIEVDGLEYTLALIDPDSIRDSPDDIGLDLPTEVVLEGRYYSRAVKAADMISDHLLFRTDADADEFIVEAEGDTDDVHLEHDDDQLIAADIPESVESLYSLDYLKDFKKAIEADAEVTISLGDEFPLELDFDYADGDGHVQYALAPRIRSD